MRHVTCLLVAVACLSGARAQDVKRNIPYADQADERQVLDVYSPAKAKDLPVVFWIHGGGWQTGDKADVQVKPQAFMDKGFVFVSTNYRLLPSVDMATIVRDVAKSIRWVHDHIAEYGGDPDRLLIMGHSAGAQLAALVCTDDRYLKAEGLSLAVTKACVPVDGDTYDVPAIIETAETRWRAHGLPPAKYGHREKFGNDPAKHRDFSAVTHVARDKGIPPFLVLYVAEHPDTTAQALRLGNVLKDAGVPVTLFGARETTHARIDADLGKPDDPATQKLFDFLDKVLKKERAGPSPAPAAPNPDSQYRLGPDSLPQEGVPKGEIRGPYTLPCAVYPGTQHTYWVYVPAQYDPATPAALMVFQDGQAFKDEKGDMRAQTVMDNLIYRREIPVMIGVFINPGRRPDQPEPTPRNWGDRDTNRPTEYNSLDDRYAQVITEELMPALRKEYNISTDPEMHGIGGSSSGAIAAFAVAWQRPDQFRKVLSNVGSFVNLRGGHVYPERVLASEKKPIRVFLCDGRNDNRGARRGAYDEKLDWFYQNVRLMKALTQKGYDVNYSWGVNQHGQKFGGAILPDMMRWLWRDGPVSTDPNDTVERSFRQPAGKADRVPVISADRIKADVAYLASDRLEGRGPGTRGEELATEYLADEFKKAGLKPAGEDGTYFQRVPLLRVVTSPEATLRAVKGETELDIPCGDGFSGTTQTQSGTEEFDAEAIFLGHGITAPEFGWDDYQGVDVKGKVVVLFTNEPPSDDPKFFGGKALTYYGRWTYKFEEAARRGARACFIIHTRETAGYPYSVVRPLEGAQLQREPGRPALAFAGWLSREAGEKLLGLSGRTVEGALTEADTKGFRPYSLGVRLKGHIPTRVEKMVSKNVAGLAEGSDPDLKAEAVVFTAHWDHLGVGRAVLGDAIYNGAADNATGCALLLELARAWSAQSPRPKRSALFLAVTAEEKGLLGSKYYTRNPLIPLGKTALDLNFDMILPLGVPESVVVTAADRTTAWPAVKAAAEKNGLEIEADQRAHLGIFFRSDHFSMAQAGVPAFSISPGMKIKGKPKDFAARALKEFNDTTYHTPQDEMKPDWDFAGFVVLARFALDVARDVANAERLPTWNPGDEFRPAREKQGVK